jgi:hypothetical protein
MWHPTNQVASSVGGADGIVQVTSFRSPEVSTIRRPSSPGGTDTAAVGPGGALEVGASAASQASWTDMGPMTASWTTSPPLMTWSVTVSPGTTSSDAGTYV